MGVRGSKYSRMIGTAGSSSLIKHRLIIRGVVNSPRPRGYVPISVGMKHEKKVRFMVHTTALGDSDFLEFLGRSAEEYGFCNQGILRIPYEARAFEEWVLSSNKAARPPKMLIKGWTKPSLDNE